MSMRTDPKPSLTKCRDILLIFSLGPFASDLLKPGSCPHITNRQALPDIRLASRKPKVRRSPFVKPGVNIDDFALLVTPEILIALRTQQKIESPALRVACLLNEHRDVDLAG